VVTEKLGLTAVEACGGDAFWVHKVLTPLMALGADYGSAIEE